jgi:hypothetical protein
LFKNVQKYENTKFLEVAEIFFKCLAQSFFNKN